MHVSKKHDWLASEINNAYKIFISLICIIK